MKRSREMTVTIILMVLITGCEESAPPSPPPLTPPPSATATNRQPAIAPQAKRSAEPPQTAAVDDVTEPQEVSLPLTAEQKADGWISLFDGHSLFGWTPNDDGVNWSVEDGAITADSGPIGLLLTTVPFANFELDVEYQMEASGNSGLFIRTLADPQDVSKDCYEINIADDHPEGFTTGAIVGHKKTEQPIKGSGDWAELKILARGNQITVQHNGTEVVSFTDEESTRLVGQIGLQKNKGKIQFRKVILKPLDLDPLFNGKDLSGWREVPGSKSQFSVEDGVIRVKDGQGFYETEETFKDFIFQAQAKTHAEELNSGFFFRALPGTEEAPSHGYDVQIHNGFKDGDRTKPNNAGTGAIFRRVEARRVVPNDNEWFTTTLVAAGPRIAVWVDGYQVVDWEDQREPDENPRKGLRLDGGHISLQGHDPTTDLSFRYLDVAELPSSGGE